MPGFSAEMAGDPVAIRALLEYGSLAVAFRKLCDRAPCVKMAAARRVNRTGNLARQSDALPFHFWIRYRDRRQQRFGIGVQRRGIKFARRRGLDNTPEIHHGNALADMLDDR